MTEWLKNSKDFLFPVLEAGKSHVKTKSVSSEACFLGHRQPWPPCPPKAEGDTQTLWGLSYKGTKPTEEGPTLRTQVPPKGPTSKHHDLGGISFNILIWGTHRYSVYSTLLLTRSQSEVKPDSNRNRADSGALSLTSSLHCPSRRVGRNKILCLRMRTLTLVIWNSHSCLCLMVSLFHMNPCGQENVQLEGKSMGSYRKLRRR